MVRTSFGGAEAKDTGSPLSTRMRAAKTGSMKWSAGSRRCRRSINIAATATTSGSDEAAARRRVSFAGAVSSTRRSSGSAVQPPRAWTRSGRSPTRASGAADSHAPASRVADVAEAGRQPRQFGVDLDAPPSPEGPGPGLDELRQLRNCRELGERLRPLRQGFLGHFDEYPAERTGHRREPGLEKGRGQLIRSDRREAAEGDQRVPATVHPADAVERAQGGQQPGDVAGPAVVGRVVPRHGRRDDETP